MIFQSTQPEWAATALAGAFFITKKISIHAARVGCGQGRRNCPTCGHISIHAARVGCDQGRRNCPTCGHISIHAARVGCDIPLHQLAKNFNPRSPRGLRQAAQMLQTLLVLDFNPRSPRGLRLIVQTFDELWTIFQSTQPKRAATDTETESFK